MKAELIEKYSMLPPGCKVLCAVSGGADSMCLLHMLMSRREELGIEVFAAHYEHGLRGDEALRDCAFVERQCREWGIELITEHGDVNAYAKLRGLGIEEAARILRYDFLNRAAEKLGCDRIATAHNADDNAETVIFNLCRGTGTAGLKGIPPVRGKIVRPLLGTTRAEIEQYLREKAVPHVEDSSNATDDYSRNLIRHRVMPVLREINPACAEAIARTSGLVERDEEYLDGIAEKFIEEQFDGESVPQKELAALHEAVSSRVIRRLCPVSLSLDHVSAVLRLREGTQRAEIDVPGIKVRREQGRIYFGDERSANIIPREIIPGTVTEFPEAGFSVSAEYLTGPEEINNRFNTFCFNYESICGTIVCTGRKPGDSIRPRGRNCTKTLKSLFTEAKMTRMQRDSTPVFRDDMGVIAVGGIAMAQRCVPKPGERVLCISISKNEKDISGRKRNGHYGERH